MFIFGVRVIIIVMFLIQTLRHDIQWSPRSGMTLLWCWSWASDSQLNLLCSGFNSRLWHLLCFDFLIPVPFFAFPLLN